jgi:hypothetical protein
VDWAGVWPMRRNPRTSDHAPGSPIRKAQEEFNQSYCELLHLLEQAFSGSPGQLGAAVGAMYGLKAQAQALMQTQPKTAQAHPGQPSSTSPLKIADRAAATPTKRSACYHKARRPSVRTYATGTSGRAPRHPDYQRLVTGPMAVLGADPALAAADAGDDTRAFFSHRRHTSACSLVAALASITL